MSNTQDKSDRGGRSDQRVAQIIEATKRLLENCEPDELTLVQIANEAGLKRTLVYHSFPSKNHILEALAGTYYAELKERCVAYFDPESSIDGRTACGGIARVYADYFNSNPVAAKLLLGAGSENSTVRTVASPESSFSALLSDLVAERTGLASRGIDHGGFPDVFQVLVQVISSLFAVGMRKEGKITPAIQDEASSLAATYLESKLHKPS